jgi:hypothetical protein
MRDYKEALSSQHSSIQSLSIRLALGNAEILPTPEIRKRDSRDPGFDSRSARVLALRFPKDDGFLLIACLHVEVA